MLSGFYTKLIFFYFLSGILLLGNTSLLQAQYNYPKEYFLFPVKPGQRNLLSGNFAELRSNHFHGGIDIKTDYRTGLPVYAAASGYIKRIRIGWYGYGNALYVKHPNGLTTVYGHLKKFNDKIQTYIKKILYNREVNTIDIDIPPGDLPVKKKEVIAYSGNTGSSGGPHLHWEVRDEKERMINPLYFDFEEIEDTRPPFTNRIALKPLSKNARVNGEFERVTYRTNHKGRGEYHVSGPLYASGKIGIEVKAYDKLNGAGNWCGIQKIELQVNNKSVFTHDIQRIAFWENRYINTHINYKAAQKYGRYYQKLYKEDGNKLNTYKNLINKGKINIKPYNTYYITIKVWDYYQNMSEINFKITGSDKTYPQYSKTRSVYGQPEIDYEIRDHFLRLTAYNPHKSYEEAKLTIGNKQPVLKRAYTKKYEDVFLWDLKKGLPDRVEAGGLSSEIDIEAEVPSQIPYQIYDERMDIYFQKNSLFDTLYLDINKNEETFQLQSEYVPLFRNIIVTLKPEETIQKKDKSAAFLVNGRPEFLGGQWTNNHIQFDTREMGKFKIKTDTIQPNIYLRRLNNNGATFKISDNLSGVKSIRATVNGKFLWMHYDYKRRIIWSERLNENDTLKGDFKLEVTDNLNNTKIFEGKIY